MLLLGSVKGKVPKELQHTHQLIDLAPYLLDVKWMYKM